VAVAILVVAPDGVRADLDPDTQTLDLFLK
jgi:hypothetical protein